MEIQQRERFEQVLRVLREVEARQNPEEFDLMVWYDKGGRDKTCGSCACAIGHCCQDSWFQKEGLTLEGGCSELGSFSLYPTFNDFEEWEAVQTFFDIDSWTANILFREGFYPENEERTSVKEVIERIESFLKAAESSEEDLQGWFRLS